MRPSAAVQIRNIDGHAKGAAGLLIVLGLGLRLALAWRPVPQLVGDYVADDMFYYLQIAKHAAEGHGSTFDRLSKTNGFHPLYLLIVTGLFSLGLGDDLVIHLALSLLALTSAAAGYFLYRIAAALAGQGIGLVGLLWWQLNPHVIAISLSGVEAALAVLWIAWASWLWIRNRDQPISTRKAITLGLLCGLAMISRTDTVFFAFALYADFLIQSWPSRGERSAQRPSSLLLSGAAAAAPVVPWLLWNGLRFGTLMQDSARALSFRSHSHLTWRIDRGVDLSVGSHILRKVASWFTELSQLLAGSHSAGIALLLLAGVAIALAIPGRQAPLAWPGRRAWRRCLFLAAYALLGTAFYTSYFWFRQRWYLLSQLFVCTLLATLVLGYVAARLQARWRYAGNALVLLCLLGLGGALGREAQAMQSQGVYPWQAVYYKAAKKLSRVVPQGQRVGAFNAGMLAFFSERQVINLDGVVNREALSALRQRKLLSYLQRRDIRYLVDTRHYIGLYSVWAEPSYPTSLTPLGKFRVPGLSTEVLLVRVRR